MAQIHKFLLDFQLFEKSGRTENNRFISIYQLCFYNSDIFRQKILQALAPLFQLFYL